MSLTDSPRPAYTLPPSSPTAREAGYTCPELPEMLEYKLCWSDCGQTDKVWITLKRDNWPDDSHYVLAHDDVLVSQMRLSRAKIRRCPVHTGKVPT